MPKLTKRFIDSLPHPASGQVFYRDTELQGFALRVTPGSKSFTYEKRIHGASRRMTIGPYPGMTVEQARKEASKHIGEIAQGHDPANARQARFQRPTFGDLEQRYLDQHASRKKSKQDDIGLLNNHLAHWRGRTLASIDRASVLQLHHQLGTHPSTVIRPGHRTARPAPRLANKMISLVRCMFNLAIDWGLFTGMNPCVRIKKFPEVSRDRFVTPLELPKLWRVLQQEPNPFIRGAFFLSLFSGARRSEVLAMQWADLDLSQRVWKIPITKAGRSHVLPLPQPVIDELMKLPRLKNNGYVFVGRWGRGHLVNVSKPWRRIRKEAGLDDVRIHDLRRTLGSWLVAAGASLPLIGKALNHSQASTTQIYARFQLDGVRAALDANATKMLAVIQQGEASPHEDQA